MSSLERRYRSALSGAVVAKAYFLALSGETTPTPAAIEQARRRWKDMETRRRWLAVEISNYEENSRSVMADLFAEQPIEIIAS